MNNNSITISTRSIVIFFTLLVLFLFIHQIQDVLLLIFTSFVIASALFPTVDWLSKKAPRGLVVSAIYLVGFIIIATLFVPFISIIVEQINEFILRLPFFIDSLKDSIVDIEIWAQASGFIPDYNQVFANATSIVQDLLNKSINITINIFSGLAATFTLAVIILFLLLDKDQLQKSFIKLFPIKYRETTEYLLVTISKKVGGYVRGQLLLMFAVGLLTAVGLRIVGLEFALLLGIIAGILEIIPIVGPIIASVPGIIVGFAQDPILGLWAALVYIIVQRIENHILTPYILGKFLEMHPLIIIIAILVAASTLGVVGVIISPAIAASVYVLVQELYLKKIDDN